MNKLVQTIEKKLYEKRICDIIFSIFFMISILIWSIFYHFFIPVCFLDPLTNVINYFVSLIIDLIILSPIFFFLILSFSKREILLLGISISIFILSIAKSFDYLLILNRYEANLFFYLALNSFLISVVFVFLRKKFVLKFFKTTKTDRLLLLLFSLNFLILTSYIFIDFHKKLRLMELEDSLKYEAAVICRDYIGYLSHDKVVGRFSDYIVIGKNLLVDLNKCIFINDYDFKEKIEDPEIKKKLISDLGFFFEKDKNRLIRFSKDVYLKKSIFTSITPETKRPFSILVGKFYLKKEKRSIESPKKEILIKAILTLKEKKENDLSDLAYVSIIDKKSLKLNKWPSIFVRDKIIKLSDI